MQVHLPDTHSWVEAQAMQAFPPAPQAGAVFPGAQLPWLSQQPVEQVLESHWVVRGLQTPLSQTSLSPHCLHACPPVPQLASLGLCTQLPLESQQPVQVPGPH